ncbi:MAG: altronate hydrolase [Betaproteobacteria bacterium RIFCSPLOWO2_12_FULL_65_14]|nr:MAG: altronate hydrolase [Betaproteobacteria bacterium RIFCSPLOWO2_12_FULL_65_14]
MPATFFGYPRSNGQFGIRNWVGVLSVMDNCNPVTRAICAAVQSTLPITTLFMRGQFGRDLELSCNTLAGMARNPNIGAVLIVGLEEKTSAEIAERIRPTGKPIDIVNIMPKGTIEAVAEGTRRAMKLALAVSSIRRTSCPAGALTIGVECGGSDTTSGLSCNPAIGRVADRIIDEGGAVIISETSEFFGAEHLFAARAASPKVGKVFVERILAFEKEAIQQGVDIRGTQPSPDNMRGGLTTIEEKALGAMAKSGSRPLVGVLDYGEEPRSRGLHFMATPAPAVESMTALAAGGCQLILFGTGVGNPIGSMVSPTIKISGNIHTVRSMPDNLDFDVSDILEKGARIADAGDRLLEYTLAVASGTLTINEVLDVRETAISRFGPTI